MKFDIKPYCQEKGRDHKILLDGNCAYCNERIVKIGEEIPKITKKQLKRLEELENEAITRHLDETDFNAPDLLDEKEAKEYCELYNLQFDYRECVCGKHREWM